MGTHPKARSLALALALLPSSYAVYPPTAFQHKRQVNGLTIPSPLPVPWKPLGCITDSGAQRSLQGSFTQTNDMTIESCLTLCKGFIFAGLEFASQCFCANELTPGTTNASASACNMACNGNAKEPCGSGNILNLFWNGTNPPPPPSVVPSTDKGLWVSQGCFSDNVNNAGRALPTGVNTNPNTIETCTAACLAAGFPFAGAEFADQCFCGSAIINGGAPIAESNCNMVCSGNGEEFCGGPNALNVYKFTGTVPPPTTGGGAAGGGGGGGTVALTVFPVTTGLPTGWAYNSCWVDNANGGRVLSTTIPGNPANTIPICINACIQQGFSIAGSEFSDECYCGNGLVNGAVIAPVTDCDMGCAGAATEACGGPNRLSVYSKGPVVALPVVHPVVVPKVGPWISLGCYSDNVNNAGRTLPVGVNTNPNTVETCTAACFANGFPIAGVEFANQCFCGTAFENKGAPIAASSCNMACSGNGSEFCGGPNALNVYNFTGTNLPPNNPGGNAGGGGGGGGGGTTVLTVFPNLNHLPAGWSYNSCWVDNAFGRILTTNNPGNPALTNVACIQTCIAQNFTIAGTEFADECFCGDTLVDGAVRAPAGNCDMGCSGNATEACGGPNAVSVYSSVPVVALPVPVPQTTNLPGNWTYAGCLQEPQNGRIFPYLNTWTLNNSAEACMNQCAAFGYPAAGVEFGIQCWCGDITDVAANGGVFGPEDQCGQPCPGDPIHLCGDGNRLNQYFWQGNLNNWHTPANTGFYEFFVPGVVVPLLATVGINNKVSFLEKHGTSAFPNSTGAYELDPSLSNDFNLMWRTMNLETDVFCSGAVVLPDIGGRILNVGGWSLQSTFGLRLYTPDGSPGVNGTNDWEENFNELSLQRGRWYPGAAVLPNGSVVVIGGETGSNASPQPNLEILPAPPGGNVVDLPFLAATDPNNLYPFIIVLPSQNLFIGYWFQALIMEPKTFTTVKQLPNMPGSVNDFLAGRTYPLEGSAVPLPQFAPYSVPLEILICGGSTIGGGIAVDNCVSIAPEAPNPTWTLERMPSQRVMPCIANLPDGTYLILNGAQHGVAGFGLATDPNLNAILYDPSQPIGSRMSILGNTIVARLYHSEATLLPDGRVLVSGSDPETPGFPEEFRIEVYVPPYLNQGFTQPSYTLPAFDWAYGGQYQITNIVLHQGNIGGMRVSLVAATSSTHGNAMGARTIFPAFSCGGTTCTITAPPNAGVSPPGWHKLFILDGPTPSVSQWVRIGGDPSKIGNWPNLPGFTRPGLA